MCHWPSRGQEKREGGAIPALSLAVADWGWCRARRVCCAPLPAAVTVKELAECFIAHDANRQGPTGRPRFLPVS
jgi:hypothetical protein